MKAKAAIFDMDGTLIDSLMFWDYLWDYLGNKYLNGEKFRPEGDVEKAVRTLPLGEAMFLVHEKCGIADSGEELFSLATELIRKFYQEEVKVKDGVLEFLEHCKECGTKMCIASATDKELVKIAMKHCGIDKYITKIFSCNDIGKGKEEPDVFLAAAEFLGEAVCDTWVFEDSYVALTTAFDAGFKTVGIYDKYGFRQDIMGEKSVEYIGEGETLKSLIY